MFKDIDKFDLILTAVILFVLLLVSIGFSSILYDMQKRYKKFYKYLFDRQVRVTDELKAKNEELENNYAELKNELNALKSENEEYKSYIDEIKDKNNKN